MNGKRKTENGKGCRLDKRSVLRFAFCVPVLLMAFTSAAPAQQPAATFRSTTRLIVQTVSVKDKDGKPVEGLTAKDFIVTEDGEPQTVSFAEFQRLPTIAVSSSGQVTIGDATDAAPAPPVAPRPAAAAGTVASTTDARIASSPPGDIRYRNRRLLILYFDLTSLPPPDLLRAYNAARKYIDTQMTPADLVAVMGFQGGGVRVKQDFTDNKAQLLEVVQTLVFGEDKDGDGIPDTLEEGTAFGQDDAEFAILNTDRQLSALQTAVGMLRPLPDQKSLVYFSSGLRLNGVDNQAQLRATTNAAIRANVSIFPVDARGLVASAPLGDATRPSPDGRRLADRAGGGQPAGRLPAVAGHALLAREGHRRQGDVRLQRPVDGHRPGGPGGHQLLHRRLLQQSHGARREVPSREDHAGGQPVGRRDVPAGLFRRQGVREIQRGRQGAPARRRADAREPGHRDHHRDGGELLPAEPRGVLRAGGGQDSRQRARARAAPRRRAHDDRLHRRGEGRVRHHHPERARQAGHQADRRDRGAARQAPHPVRNRLHAAAGQVRDQVPGPRRGNRPRRHVPGRLHHPEPEPGREAHPDQFGRARQPARPVRRTRFTASGSRTPTRT